MTRWLALVVVVAGVAAGCLQPKSQVCGDKVCAPEARCDEATSTCIPAGCGDGIVNNMEQCDGSAFGDVRDCTSLGFYLHDPVSCTESCQLDTSMCAEFCGDHVINGPELCDGEPAPGQSCLDFGFGVGRIACATGCGPAFDACSAVGLALEVAFPSTMQAVMGRVADDVFAVGGAATIAHFNGSGWSSTQVAPAGSLTALWVDPASLAAVAVGDDGAGHALAATTSDGSAWTTSVMPALADLAGVWGASADDVWAVGADGSGSGVAVHYDGTSWSSAAGVGSDPLNGVTLDATSGHFVAVGRRETTAVFDGSIWTASVTGCGSDCTTDSGSSLYDYEGVAFVPGVGSGSAQLVAVGTSRPGFFALVARSFDGGLTWASLHQDRTLGTLEAVAGTSDSMYIAGNDGVMIRYDGTAFHQLVTGTLSTVHAVWPGSATDVLVALNNGEIRRVAAAGWLDADTIQPDEVRLKAIATSPVGEMIAVGEADGSADTILSTTDAVHWSPVAFPAGSGSLNGVAFGSNCDAYVTTSSGKLGVFARSNSSCGDQSATFAQIVVPPPKGFNLLPMFALPSGDLYAGATNGLNGGIVLHGDSATAAWTAGSAGSSSQAINAIWGSSPSDVYAAGDDGLLAHTSDGATWTQVSLPGIGESLSAVWGSGPNDVFVVGARGLILHFDGTSWRTQRLANDTLQGVIGTGPHDVFAFGLGQFLHYDGVSWSPMAIPVQTDLQQATLAPFAGRNDIVFVGTNGQALTLDRAIGSNETLCNDGWDDDNDGLVDCADPDCSGDDACAIAGGACHLVGVLACGSPVAGTTFTGFARVDTLPMLDTITDGPEAVYRFDAPPGGGAVTLSLTTQQPLSLVVTQTYPGTVACDLDAPVAAIAAPGTLSFTAAPGATYSVIVDEAAGSAGDFQLTASCGSGS